MQLSRNFRSRCLTSGSRRTVEAESSQHGDFWSSRRVWRNGLTEISEIYVVLVSLSLTGLDWTVTC